MLAIAACCDCCSSLLELPASVVLEGEGSRPRLIHQSHTHPDPPVPPYTAAITTKIDNRDHTSKTYVTMSIALVVNTTYRMEFNGPGQQYLTGCGHNTPQFLVQPESIMQHTTVLTVPTAGVPTPRMTENYNRWLNHTGKLFMVEPTMQVFCECKFAPTIARVPFFAVCELPGGYHYKNTDPHPTTNNTDSKDGPTSSGAARLPCREESSTSSSTTSTI